MNSMIMPIDYRNETRNLLCKQCFQQHHLPIFKVCTIDRNHSFTIFLKLIFTHFPDFLSVTSRQPLLMDEIAFLY